tara:strand:+ start:688 stop:1821 length:1134 start_codon:yes stop_codon:yes gene_type:complete
MSDTIKVNLSKPANDLSTASDTIKVDLSKPKTEETDAVQEQTTNETVLQDEQPEVGLQEVVEGNEESENSTEQEEEVVTLGEVSVDSQEESKPIEKTIEATNKVELPENVEKLVDFMKETGGTMQDYIRLNTDYSTVDSDVLLKEYYKQTKSHLDNVEIDFLMEDKFDFDEEIDEERDIRKKKLAKKEEVAQAKKFLEGLKDKYYSDLKLRPELSTDQQKASEFFNRYNENQKVAEQQHSAFKENTKKMFTQDFKGFDFKLGEKTFRYGIQNAEKVADRQSNINNLIGKFLNDKGEVVDAKGYHKAIYAAENADTIAKHFYEQGKADAVKDVVASSKNVSAEARSTAPTDVTIGGMKVKAISGVDSSKLRIKKTFNN